MRSITLTRPDDWHLHVRDGEALRAVVPATAERFGRALIMPNLRPPVTTTAQALAYRQRVLAASPASLTFEPLMSLYLTDNTPLDEVDRAVASGVVIAAKLYPAGATTNSDAGVTAIEKLYPLFERMATTGLTLCVHGEVTDGEIDIFDREKAFIERVLSPLTRRFPTLRVVFEHVTTAEAVDFVLASGDNVAATITAHHLLLNRNAIFSGGIRPHHYCLPVLKRETHRRALLQAATGDSGRFFLGTDSAPHARSAKEAACGCAGCYTAFAGIELYAEAFDDAGALDRLEAFASLNGAAFYRLPVNSGRITLIHSPWQAPEYCGYLPGDPLVPLRAGASIAWRLQQD